MNDTGLILFGFIFVFLVVGAMVAPTFRIRQHIDHMRSFYFVPGFYFANEPDHYHRDHETGFQRDDKWRSPSTR
jgi:hypothetical protein